jgi:hypothetical protein
MRFGIMSVPQVYLVTGSQFYEFPRDRLLASDDRDILTFVEKYD